MARDETPPWPRGQTYYNGGTIDANNLGGTNFEGKEYRVEDTTYGTNQYVTIRAVRNSGSFNLLPGRLCQPDPLYYGDRINGYTNTTAAPGLPLDEFLPAAGVPPNDLAYVVMDGPWLGLTALDGGADNVIAVFDAEIALTAATSGATTAGRIATAGTTGSSTSTQAQLLNVVGRALSAKTTGNTGAGVLVSVTRWL